MDILIPLSNTPIAKNLEENLFKEAMSFSSFLADKSELTAKTYEQAIREFLLFSAKNFGVKTLREINRNHIVFFKKSMEDRALSNKTILKKLSAISSLCKHLGYENIIENDITYGITRPRTENKKETADLSDEDVKNMLNSLDPKTHSYALHYAILVVGFYTGLRSREIRNLKLADYGEINDHKVLKLKIKGDKQHLIPLNHIAVYAIENLLKRKSTLGHEIDEQSYLFTSLKFKTKKPINPNALKHIFDRALEKAGIEKSKLLRYSPHSMRATLAGHLLNSSEVPLEDVQNLLGHSSPTTTQNYNKRHKSLDKSPVYKIKFT